MGYYRSPEWRELIDVFEDWWWAATEFANFEGNERPDKSFWKSSHALVAGVHDMTRLNPQPIWDLYIAIEGWHKRTRPESVQHHHRERWPISLIEEMLWSAQIYQAEIHRLGIVPDEPELGDGESTPDGPAGMRKWIHKGEVYEGMQPQPWLVAEALFREKTRSLHVDDALRKAQPDEHIIDRDKAKNCVGKANVWFKSNRLPWKLSKAGDYLSIEKTEDSSEESPRNP